MSLSQISDVLESQSACQQANECVQHFLPHLTSYTYYNALPMEDFDIPLHECSVLLLRRNVKTLHWQCIVVAVSCQSGFDKVLQLKVCTLLLGAAHTVIWGKAQRGRNWRGCGGMSCSRGRLFSHRGCSYHST